MESSWTTFGFEAVKNILDKQMKAGKLAQAYLFCGPEGIGKKTLAVELAKKILQTENVSNHPDFQILSEEGEISVERVRQFIAGLSYKPFFAEKKVAIIDSAQNLNTQSGNALLKTLVSRFYLISGKPSMKEDAKEAENFIVMSLQKRIDFIKELLTEIDEQDEEGNEVLALDSTRSKALKFLNSLEGTLHKNTVSKVPFDTVFFEHIYKVREFLRMPGSSPKTLLESVALVVPQL